MNAPQQNPQRQAPQQSAEPTTRWVIAVRPGYYGNLIRRPDGDEKERAPFEVPVGLKGSWFVDAPQHIVQRAKAKKRAQVDDSDLG